MRRSWWGWVATLTIHEAAEAVEPFETTSAVALFESIITPPAMLTVTPPVAEKALAAEELRT